MIHIRGVLSARHKAFDACTASEHIRETYDHERKQSEKSRLCRVNEAQALSDLVCIKTRAIQVIALLAKVVVSVDHAVVLGAPVEHVAHDLRHRQTEGRATSEGAGARVWLQERQSSHLLGHLQRVRAWKSNRRCSLNSKVRNTATRGRGAKRAVRARPFGSP
eukprot:2390454-Pleurochrysis_carterae.AAC.3